MLEAVRLAVRRMRISGYLAVLHMSRAEVHASGVRARDAFLAAAALAAGVGAAWLAVDRAFEAGQPAGAPLALIVGWSFIGSGAIAWRQRPGNRLGAVMVVTGFAWLSTFLADSNHPLLFTVGTAVESVYLVGLGFLILSFPSGRLRGRADRALVWSAAALVSVVEVASLLFSDSHAMLCGGCPANVFEVERNDALANGILQGQRLAGVTLALVMVGLLASRWRQASGPQRRSVAPVAWTGTATLVALGVSVGNDVAGHPLGQAPRWVLGCALASIPVAVLVVLVQHRLARAAVAGLVVELGAGGVPADLREALARALGDPSLELVYWFPGGARYVDGDGRLVELPRPGGERAATVVERGGQPVAALVHDRALLENAELVDSVCAATALMLDNGRLQAELRARLGDLQASRARLVEATETERRRIERDLHDGTQQRLVSISMSLGLAESRLTADPASAGPIVREARVALAVALQELRELSQGIHPSVLTERGLAAALEDLSRRAPLPAQLDTTLDTRPAARAEAAGYFVVSEAVSNAAKHAQASKVRISASAGGGVLVVEVADDGIGGASASGGSGLRGLADRVEAVGGRLTLSSPPGRGTTLRAEIPCG